MTQDNGGGGPRYRAPALDKGLDILEILAARSEGMTRAELLRALGRGPSEIYRMLERLVARGYVVRTEGGDRYALSLRMFLIAHRHPPLRRLLDAAQPLMDDFSHETGQSCHLVVRERRSAVVVAHATPETTWELRVRVGAELSLLDTGSGLTLLAFQPPGRDAEALRRWGFADVPDERLRSVAAHLAAIREAGHRDGRSGQVRGVTDLSVPVFGLDRDAIAVLTCAFIDHPDQTERSRDVALSRLREIASALSHGNRGDS